MFSRPDVDACVMTEHIYNQTSLRERNYQEIYKFKWDDGLVVEKQVYGLDVKASQYANYSKYGLVWDRIKFDERAATAQAWLALTPQQMLDYCHEYKISEEQGCRVSLTLYNSENPPTWYYDYGFGISKA